jgi:hypothetical protein
MMTFEFAGKVTLSPAAGMDDEDQVAESCQFFNPACK